MRRILIVSHCSKRGESLGLIGKFLTGFSGLDKNEYVIDLCDTNYFQEHDSSQYPVNEYYGIKKGWIDKVVLKVPKLRSVVSVRKALALINNAINKYFYDLVVVYSVPAYTYKIIEFAHSKGSKTILIPWGANDIINRPELDRELQIAFDNTDYVSGIEGSNCSIVMQNKFKVPLPKFKYKKPYLRSVEEIIRVKEKYDREGCARKLNIPLSSCYIICGYNAFPVMLHEYIIDSLAKVKELLPSDYVLVFPMTYPRDKVYTNKVKEKCASLGLNAVFFTSFLTNEQVACLHLLSNYFINIQYADAGNAFQIEELFCGSQTITGKWLRYSQFEKFGIPYYQLEKLEELPSLLKRIFSKEILPVIVPEALKNLYYVPANFKRSDYWKQLIDSI